MKKCFLVLGMLLMGLPCVVGQIDAVFTTVPETNGKVVFEQFVLTEQGLSGNRKYEILQKWLKDTYSGSPTVTGMRFDDKGQSATVSVKTELPGMQEKTVMNYRFDLSVASTGCVLVVRDINYQITPKQGASSAPKVLAAEQAITDQAVNADGDEGKGRSELRKATLGLVNDLYKNVSGLF